MSEVTRFVVLVFGTEAGGELTAWSSAGLKVGRHRPPNADSFRGLWPNSTSISSGSLNLR